MKNLDGMNLNLNSERSHLRESLPVLLVVYIWFYF